MKNFIQLFLALLLIPLAGNATISIEIIRPMVDYRIRDNMHVEVSVTSTSTVDTVWASVDGRTVLLKKYAEYEAHYGDLSLIGMTQGPLQLVIYAKNIAGDTVTVTRRFIYDRAPVVTVESPMQNTSYQSKIHVKATVVDPGHVNARGVIAIDEDENFSIPFINSIDTIFDPYPGRMAASYPLNIHGVDSLADRYGPIITVFMDKSRYLTPVYTDTGLIKDVDSSRILIDDVVYGLTKRLKIYNTVTSASSFVNLNSIDPYNSLVATGLCKGGAWFLRYHYTTKRLHQLYLWYGDSLIYISGPLKTNCLEEGIQSAGNTLIWTTGSGKTAITDLSTLKTIFLPVLAQARELSRDGNTIVYSAGTTGNYNIYSYSVSSKVITQITFSGNNINPSIDGNNIVYAKEGVGTFFTYLNDGTADYNLGENVGFYILSDGYVAFVKRDSVNINQRQIWLRTPAKVLRKVANIGFPTGFEKHKLGADGRLIFMEFYGNGEQARLYADSITSAAPVSGTLGNTYFVHNSFYLALGRTLYAYNIPPPPQITAITPDSAMTGNTVTIKGLHFANTSAVSFGGTAAASFTIVSDSVITAVVGAGNSGDVSVTTPLGTATFSGFHFVDQPPQITAITPDSAITGNTVTIKGLHFANTSDVSFGGTAATSFIIVSDSVITAVVGAGSSGDVSVTTLVGTATFSGFYFVDQLPAQTFNIISTSITCRGAKDGSIRITVQPLAPYTVSISGPGINEEFSFDNGTAVINDLDSGTYNICLNPLNNPEYQQCFTSVITAPEDLSTYIAVNQDERKVTLSLTGAELYHVKLNDIAFTTKQSQVTLDLKKGLNRISVNTDRSCQGIITKDIMIGTELVIYPNPFHRTIHFNLGTKTVQKAVITVYNAAGKIVYTHGYSNQSGIVTIDLPDISDGFYMLRLAADNEETIFKLLKK